MKPYRIALVLLAMTLLVIVAFFTDMGEEAAMQVLDETPEPAVPRPAQAQKQRGPKWSGPEGQLESPTRRGPEEANPQEVAQVLDIETPQRIYSKAAFCYQEEPGEHEALRAEFTVVIAEGRGHLEDIVIKRAEWNAPRLQGCVEDTLRNLKWAEKWNPPGRYEGGQSHMTILGLRQRSRFLAIVPRPQ
jgi:hypothetical protein